MIELSYRAHWLSLLFLNNASFILVMFFAPMR